MKDATRKKRDWDNDNFCMLKFGGSIRAKIAEALIPPLCRARAHVDLDAGQKAALASIPVEQLARA